nr:cytochrome P450 [Methylobacterium sp. 174MFSha1.1]
MLDEIREEPLAFLARMRRQYGDVVGYGTDAWRAVLISHPDHIRHVLVTNVRNYAKEGTPDLRMLKPMLGDGLLTSDGETWRAQRHLLAPLFRRNMVEAFGPLIVEAAVAVRGDWAARPGRAIEVGAEMSRLTLRIVARALFGYDLSDDADPFTDAVEILNEAMGGLTPRTGDARFRFIGALAVIHDVVERAVAARHGNGHAEGLAGGPGGVDALSLLLAARDGRGLPAMTDRALIDQSVTLLLAGHETTAKALTWTFHLLARHPKVERRVGHELARLGGCRPTVEDLPSLPYLAAVLREAMRLFTPIWIVSRIAVGDDVVGGHHVPAGTLVPISPYLVHRHEAFWPEAERFDPDRFMPERTAGHHAHQFLPFGAGPRHCIGEHFAMMELQLVLATLLQTCRLRPADDRAVVPEALVTLRPRGGLRMIPEPWDGASPA